MPAVRAFVRRLAATLVALVPLVVPGLAAAQTFDGGIPTLWNCTGRCGTSVANGSIGLAPNAGQRYGFVTTAGSNARGLFLPGVGGTGSASNGSVLRSGVFAAGAGDVLSFWFNYVTRDGAGFADYAWSRLLTADGSEVALLFTARTTTAGSVVPGTNMPAPRATLGGATTMNRGAPSWAPLGANESGGAAVNCWDTGCGFTGWISSQFAIAGAGSYMLEFGVVNWDPYGSGDTAFQSGLAFDGVRINNQAVAVSGSGQAATAATMAASAPMGSGVIVPEPSSLALFAAGAGVLAVVARRRSVVRWHR